MRHVQSVRRESDDEEIRQDLTTGAPIADLFPETTVLFADIVGFTAWSSTRDPGQVFTLLEAVYQAFDEIASRHGIFKVETIGDCYVGMSWVCSELARNTITTNLDAL
jgi:class 3 adenylate cyclase